MLHSKRQMLFALSITFMISSVNYSAQRMVNQSAHKAEVNFLLALHALKHEDVDRAQYHLSQAKELGFLTNGNPESSWGITTQDRYKAAQEKVAILKKNSRVVTANIDTLRADNTKINSVQVENSVELDQEEIERAHQELHSIRDLIRNRPLTANTNEQKINDHSPAKKLYLLNRFKVSDGSRIDRVFIDAEKQEARAVVRDNKRQEEITVIGSLKQLKANTVVSLLPNYAIQKNPKFKTEEEDQDHNFGQMVDYAVQALAEKILNNRKLKSKNQTFLKAAVIRRNLVSGQLTNCVAEYFYYSKEGKYIMYYRLLRRRPNIYTDEKYKKFLETGTIEFKENSDQKKTEQKKTEWRLKTNH